MAKKSSLTSKEQALLLRYLIWCYKTTKEDIDRIDRYFTQAVADDYFIKRFKSLPQYKANSIFNKSVEDFVAYAAGKKAKAQERKFADSLQKELHPDYEYLRVRFEAIEQAICYFFDKKELSRINALYEAEMTERILKAREHT